MKAPIDDGTDDEYQMEVSHLKPQGMQGWLQVKPGDEEHAFPSPFPLPLHYNLIISQIHLAIQTNTFGNVEKVKPEGEEHSISLTFARY